MKRGDSMLIRLLCLVFVLICGGRVVAQQNLEFASQVANKLFDNVAALNEEKLFLHVDKTTCLPGDTLWFRAFLASAVTNREVDYSRYIYVELADRTDSVHFREKIGRSGDDSLFAGYFIVPDNLSQGEYFLRSYTYWMQNQPVDFYDVKRIRVVNPFDHRVKIECDVENRREGRTLIISFKNSQGVMYENVDFLYSIPGEMAKNGFVLANTGYSGRHRVTVHDTASDCIYIKSPIGAKLDFERLLYFKNDGRDYHVEFMPEGGNLVQGGLQRVGVKCVCRDGMGMGVSGVVYDADGEMVTTFETNQFGMGSFEFYVESTAYNVEVESNQGVVKRYNLPKVHKDGAIALRLEPESNRVKVGVAGECDRDNYYLLIHSRGIALGLYKLGDIDGLSMDFLSAPEGIIHFLLIDEMCKVHSERLWFNRKYVRPDIVLEEPYQRASGRENEIVSLFLEGESEDLEGDFSVAVVNNRYTLEDDRNAGIDAYMLLTSELSGYVESPGYYFESDDYEHERAMDDLMLTQGWRRFNVEKMLMSDTLPRLDYYMERGQFLSGYVEDFRGRRSANSEIYIYGSNGVESYATTDENGEFLVEDIYFHGGTHFTATANSAKGRSNVVISLENQQFKPLENVIPMSVFVRNDDDSFYKKYGRDYIYSDNGVRLSALGEVSVVKGYKQQKYELLRDSLEERAANLFLLGITDVRDYGGYGNFMSSWGEYISSPAKKIEQKFDNGNTIYEPGSTMDNIEYYERIYKEYHPESHRSANMKATGAYYRFVAKDMERPEMLGVMLDSQKFWGNGGGAYGGFGGIASMSISTVGVYAPQVPHFELSFNIQTIVPLAPQLSELVEFYQPKYEAVAQEQHVIVDEMITRYWNPLVRFGKDEVYNVVFPRAADGDTYTIIVEGFASDGTPIHFSKIIR